MAVNPAQLRARMVSVIDTALSGSGWRESPMVPGALRHNPRTELNKAWDVAVTETQVLDPRRLRGSGTEAVQAQTRLTLAFLRRLRPDAQREDYETATGSDEVAFAAALHTFPGSLDCGPPILRDIRRQVDGEGAIILTTVVVDIEHLYALA